MDDIGHEEYRSELVFFLNSKKVVLNDVQPETTLLQYLRSTGMDSESGSEREGERERGRGSGAEWCTT